MLISIKKQVLEEMTKLFPANELVYEPSRWSSNKDVDTKFLSKDEVDKLIEIYNRDENKEEIDDRRQLRNLNSYLNLIDGKGKKIKSLKTMTDAIKMVFEPLEKKWIFVRHSTAKIFVPYFIKKIKHSPRTDYSPQHISIDGVAIYRGASKGFSQSIFREDLTQNGCLAEDLLVSLGIYIENPELIEEYENDLKAYNEICEEIGLQLIGHGKCYAKGEERWSSELINLDKGGIVSKLIIDDDEDRDSSTARVISSDEWSSKHGLEGEEEIVFELPVQPFIRVFNLKIHEFIHIHVRNTEIYEYEKELTERLVLGDDKRELIDLLVSSGGDDSRDIVQGKSGGVIIVTSGPPGTGKTLTSEVFSEKVERPLYVVQCSQLGTKPDKLEKELETVLEQAVRWNAVLLIDEADVYIHERGDDIAQNAIVGVFLRLLEYYSGVLFMTTNRATVIDDAIISRCIAHVKYEMPTDEELFKLWKILSKQYDVEFDDELCKNLVDNFPKISGRSVKQLIRLSKALAVNRGEKITVETVAWVSRFQHIEISVHTKKKFPIIKQP